MQKYSRYHLVFVTYGLMIVCISSQLKTIEDFFLFYSFVGILFFPYFQKISRKLCQFLFFFYMYSSFQCLSINEYLMLQHCISLPLVLWQFSKTELDTFQLSFEDSRKVFFAHTILCIVPFRIQHFIVKRHLNCYKSLR